MISRSYAKINLGLRILGRRPDGYHNLVTVFHRIDLYDTIHFHSAAVGAAIECSDPALPCDRNNLCIRAAEAVLRHSSSAGVSMVLEKRIPLGAGLGGGSSNAATVLRALPRFLGIEITDDELRAIALQLGSDVPFFLLQGCAEGRGRGEILIPLTFNNPWWILTATPAIHVSTTWAYSSLPQTSDAADFNISAALCEAKSAPLLLQQVLHNDFETPVSAVFPQVRQLLQSMKNEGAIAAAMSGSGPTVFGLFADRQQAVTAQTVLPADSLFSLTPPGFSPEA